MSSKFKDYWYFFDVIKQLAVYHLVMALIASYLGYFIFDKVCRLLINRGVSSQVNILTPLYRKAVDTLKGRAISDQASSIAEKWFSRSERKIMLMYKLGVFICGVSLQSIALFYSFVDFIFGIIFFISAVMFAWFFGLNYYRAIMPRKMLLDASLGLSYPEFQPGFGELA